MKFSIFLITTIYGARNDNRTTERRCSCRSGFQILNSLITSWPPRPRLKGQPINHTTPHVCDLITAVWVKIQLIL